MSSLYKEYYFIHFFRAISAFWVLCSHVMIWGGWYGFPLPNAKMAVDVFMIISGYLMMHQTCRRIEKEPMTIHTNWYKFWIRRFFRIAPAYYLSLVLAVVLGNLFLDGYYQLQNMNLEKWSNTTIYDPSKIEYTISNIFLHLTFLFGLDPQASFSTFLPDWSLSLEMQFYFIFPFLFLLLKQYNPIYMIILIGVLGIVSTWFISQYVYFYEPSLLVFKVQYFLVGIILYDLLHVKHSLKTKVVYLFVSLVLLLIESRFTSFSVMIIFLFMWYFGYLEHQNKSHEMVKKVFDNSIIRFMSKSAYSVYLFHGFFIAFAGLIISEIDILKYSSLFIHTVFIWFFVVLMVYPFSYIVYTFVEKRGMEYGKKIIVDLTSKNKEIER